MAARWRWAALALVCVAQFVALGRRPAGRGRRSPRRPPRRCSSQPVRAQVQGRSPAEAGLEFPPFNLAVVAGSRLGPRVAAAVGARTAMVAGLVAVAAGAAAMTGIPAAGGGYLGVLLPGFVLMGGGLGCASVASTAAGTTATAERRGLGAGLLNAAAQVGTAMGLAVLVTVATARSGDRPYPAAIRPSPALRWLLR